MSSENKTPPAFSASSASRPPPLEGKEGKKDGSHDSGVPPPKSRKLGAPKIDFENKKDNIGP